MGYSRILPRLVIGSYPQTAAELKTLQQQTGITAVLNLQTDEDIQHFGLSWRELEERCQTCSIVLRRVPVSDFDTADLARKLPEAVRVLNELLLDGHTVYLHCSAGVGRSPTVAVAYLMWHRGLALEEAVAQVKELRPCSPNLDAIRSVAAQR